MTSGDTTQASNLPDLIIIMDREIGRRDPDKAFYLRIQTEDSIQLVELAGAVTPIDARKIARGKGYEPTFWMEAGGSRAIRFY